MSNQPMNSITAKSKYRWFTPERLIWIFAVACVVIFQALPGPRPLDDSYITFRYARNLSSGIGFVYNPGEFVQGTTTPFYTLLLALFSSVFGSNNLPFLSFVIALIADVLNTLLLFRISKKFIKHEHVAFIMAMVFLLQPFRLNVSIGGMETSLFITMLLAMYDRYFVGSKIYAAALFGSLAILTRPDAVLAVGPVFLHALWNNRSSALKALLLGAGILAPWVLWATWYFGNPIPYSIIAKTVSYQNYSPSATLLLVLTFLGTGTIGPYKELIVIFPGLVFALFLVIFGISWVMKGNQESFVIISYPFLYFLVMTISHAPLFFCWYYLPLMPCLLLLFFGAFLRLFPEDLFKRNWYQREILLGLFSFILIAIPALLMHFLPGWADSRQIERLYMQASSYVKPQTANKVVYAPDIGVIGWTLEKARVLDPIGLVSPISVDYINRFRESGSPELKMVQDLQPDFVIARKSFIKNLLNDPGFYDDYELIWQKGEPPVYDEKVVIYKRK